MASQSQTEVSTLVPRPERDNALCGIPASLQALVKRGIARIFFALVVCLAAMPMAGVSSALIWLTVTLVFICGEQRWFLPPGPLEARAQKYSGIFSWLLSAGYAAVALYFLYYHTGVGQTFGVTLLGVIMFKVLVADHANPKRLLLNLTPPTLALAFVQLAGAMWRIQQGQPLEIITLLACPLVVFLVFRSVQNDLTEGRSQLSASEARFRMLADHSKDVVVWMQMDGKILYASPSVASLGYSPTDVLGRKTTDFVHPDDVGHAIRVTWSQIQGTILDPSTRREYRFLTAWGTYVWMEGSPTVIRDESGQPTSIVNSYRDVSIRRQLEIDLIESKIRAEAASEAKAAFLANMSHEIRTPLTGIIGFSSLLDTIEDLPSLAATYARRIGASGHALLTVVNDILDFSKLDAKQVSLDPQPFDVRTFFEDTVAVAAGQAAEKGLDLDLEIAANVPSALLADSSRLRQVILNLVNNAVKFTDEGWVQVAAGYDADDGRLHVIVTDTGPGIPTEGLSRLFQRFSQVDESVSRRHGGTGLGLSISKNLVELMGGEIKVVSTEHIGSTFSFWITATPCATEVVDQGSSPNLEDDDIYPAHILVVDDLAANRELIRAVLQAAGHRVEDAESGSAALEAAKQTQFDVILMDLQMPGMDGATAARTIRNMDSLNRSTPIIAVSANVLPEHRLVSAEAGMNDHFGKPIIPAQLLGGIARWQGIRCDAGMDSRFAERH